jgi:transcriptional regulator with XRE-family HTH domain
MSRLNILGKNIRKYREEKGLSQEKLSEIVDLSREYIARVETGHKRISLKKLFEIADALEIKCSQLIDFD